MLVKSCSLFASKGHQEVADTPKRRRYLGDRKTTIRQHLAADPTIMNELPPRCVLQARGCSAPAARRGSFTCPLPLMTEVALFVLCLSCLTLIRPLQGAD